VPIIPWNTHWSIGNIFLTAFLGFFGLIIGGIIVGGAIAVLWVKVSEVWEKTGLPYTMDRLDKRFGPFYTGLIMVAGTITFFIVLGVIFALIETARW